MVECTALEMRHTGDRIGGSNPPLSAPEPSGTDTTRPNPSDNGGSGVLRLAPPATRSRQHPTGTAPSRPPTATQNATRLLPADADLAAVVAAWPTLPEPIRAGILAMVRAASEGQG